MTNETTSGAKYLVIITNPVDIFKDGGSMYSKEVGIFFYDTHQRYI